MSKLHKALWANFPRSGTLEKSHPSLKMFGTLVKAAVFLATGFGLTVGSIPSPAFAQANLRNSFPGRRVGGGPGHAQAPWTRGCRTRRGAR